ncbi:MAG: hypothetical protein MUO63_09985 [Desulfobulbaceae bacterium]|nr:hypothetical protein [Desulfobulbaceae bacterium]
MLDRASKAIEPHYEKPGAWRIIWIRSLPFWWKWELTQPTTSRNVLRRYAVLWRKRSQGDQRKKLPLGEKNSLLQADLPPAEPVNICGADQRF